MTDYNVASAIAAIISDLVLPGIIAIITWGTIKIAAIYLELKRPNRDSTGKFSK